VDAHRGVGCVEDVDEHEGRLDVPSALLRTTSIGSSPVASSVMICAAA